MASLMLIQQADEGQHAGGEFAGGAFEPANLESVAFFGLEATGEEGEPLLVAFGVMVRLHNKSVLFTTHPIQLIILLG